MTNVWEHDMSQFMRYAHNMADSVWKKNSCKDEEFFMRYWRDNKSKYLYNLLGKELILTKHISFERPVEEMRQEMERLANTYYDFQRAVNQKLHECLNPKWSGGISIFNRDRNSDAVFIDTVEKLFSTEVLIGGVVPVDCKATVLGHQIQLTRGQKAMRAIGRIAGFLDLSERFEEYRIAHSQVLNQKRVSGDLHLSIHPLDYATASDNANGWSSCMSWEEHGCYRLGTVEMMNSPYVLCAYLSGKNIMTDVGGDNWNSKKWRAWVIVDPDIILVNRQYPYDNDDVSMTVVEWVKELAETNLGWSYNSPERDVDYNHITFETNYMYNDVGSYHPGALSTEFAKHHHYRDLNFSGPAECMWCGAEIPYNCDYEASTLCCEECQDILRCSCCNRPLCEDDAYYSPDGEALCCDCYSDQYLECERCGEVSSQDDAWEVTFPVDNELLLKFIKEEGPESAIYKRHTRSYWRDPGPIRLSDVCVDAIFTTVCRSCLENRFCVEDLSEALMMDYKVPYAYSYSKWSEYEHRNLINPDVVDFETIVGIFCPYNKWEDTDGSFGRVWKKLYDDYKVRLTLQENGF